LGYAGGGPSRKSFSLGKIFSSGNNGLDLAGFTLGSTLPAFTPLSIAGAILWLDAADPNATGTNSVDGATISTWRDKSGLRNNGTASGTLTIINSGLNSRPTMNFNGSAWFAGSIVDTGPTMTAFVVLQHPVVSAASFIRFLSMAPTTALDQDAGGILAELTSTANIVVANGNESSQFPQPNNTPYIIGFQANGTNLIAYLNGTAQPGSASTTNFNITRYRVGSMVSNDLNIYTGYISEVLIYSTSITASERQTVEGYLAWKWGLQGSLPENHPYKKTPPVG
jgi:hypothetical protein